MVEIRELDCWTADQAPCQSEDLHYSLCHLQGGLESARHVTDVTGGERRAGLLPPPARYQFKRSGHQGNIVQP